MAFGNRITDTVYTGEQPSQEHVLQPIASEADLTAANGRTLDQWLGDPAQPKVLVHCASSNRVDALLALRARWLHGSGEEAALATGRAAGLKGLEPAVRSLLARSMGAMSVSPVNIVRTDLRASWS